MRFARALLWMCAAGMSACAAPPKGDGASAGAAPIPAAAASSSSLAGTRWMGVIDPALDKRATPWLEFIAEGRLAGFTGCNMLSGAWRNDGGEIRLGPIITTKRGCMGPEGDVERRVIAALNERSRVTRDGAKLVFTGSAGERFEFTEAK